MLRNILLSICLLIASDSRACNYLKKDLIGKWTSIETTDTLVFNKDFTCVLNIDKKNIVGKWGIGQTRCELIVLIKNGDAEIYKVTMFDDGESKDGLATKLGLIFCGTAFNYEYTDGKGCITYRLEKP